MFDIFNLMLVTKLSTLILYYAILHFPVLLAPKSNTNILWQLLLISAAV
jgi:hypothetical protein